MSILARLFRELAQIAENALYGFKTIKVPDRNQPARWS